MIVQGFLLLSILSQAHALWPFTASVDVGPDGSVVAETPQQPTRPGKISIDHDGLEDALDDLDLGENIEVKSVKMEIRRDPPQEDKVSPGTLGPDGKISAYFVNHSPSQVRENSNQLLTTRIHCK